ncbi:hypothetical protein L6164_016226 [Bauhinia variegata]|uniref:Uncharacterized protein n=1 Tax=Bauhinia variegata TaxID=167791 RepID=A0ACB9NN00_BAUVA|nr:hypothetical protein L6164_016226 [Bauhinia variegata]
MLKTKAFKGANVFMSRNLVPPEVFDALHDALKENGAEIFLCCDPSRNGPHDYHVISSIQHEKFKDLRAKGCNLIGPQCLLSCAKEHRALPKQGFTCCRAMDGVKVLASGFEMDEKVKIGELVTAMGGVLHTKASLDVSFVIVKNVLAAKYKWALHILKKPIVTINWLYQCWTEHRVVPQESYRVPPFSGLTICVTKIPADERIQIEKLILQNGGKYSGELTKKCTHLIFPEGDKYKVAKRWGHIHIVTRKWFDQSVARRACLNEESYPVQDGSVLSHKITRDSLSTQYGQEKDIRKLQSAASTGATDSDIPVVSCAKFSDGDLEATQSQNMSSAFSVPSFFVKEGDAEGPPVQSCNEPNLDGAVANDSESDNNDLYLSECRILLVGFEASEMRKLVNMVRKGGGSRYMVFNDKLTHIVIGTLSETEKKDVRSLAALGVIYVVKTTWLEDCDREKKEVPVLKRHVANDLLLPKDTAGFAKGAITSVLSINQGKSTTIHQNLQTNQVMGTIEPGVVMSSSLEKNKEMKMDIGVNDHLSLKATGRSTQKDQHPVSNKMKGQQMVQLDLSVQNVRSSTVFRGKIFCFSNSFPEERRAEIVQWISQGGGDVVNGYTKQNVHYIVECHGVTPKCTDAQRSTCVSSHWIRSCLEDGSLHDVASHILYSPLPCQVPFPGFESFRFCVSQYEEKDRILLRNLCFVLGAKFVEKLTKKVTHLLCKFSNGPKYEAACKWGIQSVTSEWIFECVKQNGIVAVDPFLPKEVTAQDQEAGLCTVSQFPTQAVRMISADSSSQFPSQSQNLTNTANHSVGSGVDNYGDNTKISSVYRKKARLLEEPVLYDKVSSKVDPNFPINDRNSTGDHMLEDKREVSYAVPDVAAAIEDLLEHTRKMNDQKSPGRTGCKESIFSSDCSVLGEDHSNPHTVIGLSKHWLNRSSRKDDSDEPSKDRSAGIYDGFSETQTESQVVGYEEDLSGRQMLIDRVRTRGSLT